MVESALVIRLFGSIIYKACKFLYIWPLNPRIVSVPLIKLYRFEKKMIERWAIFDVKR